MLGTCSEGLVEVRSLSVFTEESNFGYSCKDLNGVLPRALTATDLSTGDMVQRGACLGLLLPAWLSASWGFFSREISVRIGTHSFSTCYQGWGPSCQHQPIPVPSGPEAFPV